MKRRSIINTGTALLLALALQLAGCGDLFNDEQKTMQMARDYLQSGKIHAAAIELRNTLQENPQHAEARFLLANFYLDYGDYATAEKEFRQAGASGWNEAEVAYGVARSHLGMGNFRNVFEGVEIRESWSAQERANLLALRAVAEAGLGKQEDALASLEAGRQLDAGSHEVLRTGIKLQVVSGNMTKAATLLQQALQHYPDDPELLMLQAGMAPADEQPATRAIYQRVIDLDPDGFISVNGRMARLQLAQLHIIEQQLDQAETAIKPLYRRNANDPFVNYLGGVIAFQRGDYENATELLLKVLKLAPEHNPTRLLFGTVSFAMKNFEQAAYFLSKYLVAVPDNLVARKLLARSYILLERYDEATETLQSVLTGDANDGELLALAGMSELNRGNTAAGIAGLERAVRVEPGSMILRGELAKAYIEAGETGQAISELRSILDSGGDRRQTETLLVMAHLRAGDHSKAINQVLEMVSLNPDDPAVHALAGNVFAASGDHAEARTWFTRALQQQPGFSPATLALANVEELDGNYAEASLLYEQLVNTGMESVLPMLALARVAERQGDRDALLDWLQRALAHAPNDIKPRLFLAEYYLREDRREAARQLITEALELEPDEPALLALSGRIFMAGKKYRQALQPLQTLVSTEPASSTARILLGECYFQLGRLEDARRELRVALENSQASVSALALLARVEVRAGNYDEALKYSRDIQQAFPELFLGYELAGDSLMAGEQFEAAAGEYAHAWERMPSAGLVVKRAENASRSGKPDVALGYLEDWRQAHPGDVHVLQFLGVTYQNTDRLAQARAAYEEVIAVDANNAVALNNLAGIYLAAGQPEALGLAERAWQAEPDNPGIQDTYGWALVQNGQVGRGLQLLEQAVKALPDIPDVRYHHAVAVFRAGNKAKARLLLKSLLNEDVPFDGRQDAERLLQ